MPKKNFADQVKKLRASDSLSQSEAAETWGVNLKTLQGWEIGKTEPSPFFAKCVLFYLRWRNRVPVKK